MKIQAVQTYLNQEKMDLAIFSDPMTISYLTGFASDPHERHMFLFVPEASVPLLFVPALEVDQARSLVDFPVIGYLDNEDPWTIIAKALKNETYTQIGAEYDHLNLTRFKGLSSVFGNDFHDVTPLINQMKVIKSADEIEKMKVAGQWADKAMQIAFDHISTDKTEMDLIAQIEFELKKQGISKMSFDTMVLTGSNAANPHGLPSTRKIEKDTLLLFDLGVATGGYTSDMTRTVAVGQPDTFKQDIYHLVLEAQMTALSMIKPGVTASQIDAAARDVIEKAGYGEFFNHRLGHGLGSSVHEFPSIMAGNDLVIEPGMCFSVEPGIYIPGKVGVRIEDCGVVTETGFDLFTETPKELLYFEG